MKDLAERGALRLGWARDRMAVLATVRDQLLRTKTLRSVRVGMALHVEAKTGVLALTLREAGAKVRLASCNPLTTDDSVATALKAQRLAVYARKGESEAEYYENLHKVLDLRPQVVVDDGGDLTYLVHTKRQELLDGLIGGTEETTTGVVRLRAMAAEGALRFPVIDVNDAATKHLFDNRYGTGQSVIDGLMSATNLLLAGKRLVVAGYGWCGRGVAARAAGMAARVTVTEVDPVRAIEASLDGFDVAPMEDAIRTADFVVTATGCKDVVREEHLRVAKDRCLLANAGHFDVEISKAALEKLAKRKRRVREFVDEYTLRDGRRLYLLGDGRLINLVAGQGHPVEIMDMSFSLQALCAAYLAKEGRTLSKGVHDVPRSIDEEVARLKLATLGLRVDALTPEQRRYLRSWREGT